MELEHYDRSSHIQSWLSAITPAGFDQSPTSTSPILQTKHHDYHHTSSISPTRTSRPTSYESRGRTLTRGTKRKRRMQSDIASTASGGTKRTRTTDQLSLHDRPFLPFPSTSRARSQSPTRRQELCQLKYATPSVRIRQPDIEVTLPAAVQALKKTLIEALKVEVLPHGLKTRLEQADPDQIDMYGHLFDKPIENPPSTYASTADALWEAIDEIYKLARVCHDSHADESAWVTVVKTVLKSAGLEHHSSMLRYYSIQTQSIDPALLPKHPSQSYNKKPDFSLGFSDQHPKVAAILEPVLEAKPGMALSQMLDAWTSTFPLACSLEVKQTGGDYNEAILQLGIWCTAGLERLYRLRASGRDLERGDIGGESEELLPFIGWTVVGHDWKFHISWKDTVGNVTVLGPWSFLNASTSSHVQILVLLKLIQTVKKWLEEVYWTWLSKNVLDGLK